MSIKKKAEQAANLCRAELKNPVFRMAAPGAGKAIEALASTVEALAHELDVLTFRANQAESRIKDLEGVNFGD